LAGGDRAAGRRVKFRADNGVSGRIIQLEVLFRVDPVEMPEKEAKSFLRAGGSRSTINEGVGS